MEDAGIERRIILNWIFRKWDVGTGWIDVTQDRDGWWDLENAKMNMYFP